MNGTRDRCCRVWALVGGDSEMEVSVQEVYWRMLLELTPVEEKKRKCDWAQLGALKRDGFSEVS